MAHKPGQVNVSAHLLALKHNEKQNKDLKRLPANTTITRRPIIHGPIASPFAGPKAQKVVYVSRKTPVMSAVKRVKRFLREIEKRAMRSQGVDGAPERSNNRRGENESLHRKLESVSDKLRRDAEAVLVKASGRAMEQALRIAEWFRSKEDEMTTTVEVKTGSVSVVDDIVELDEESDGGVKIKELDTDDENDETALEGGETTMELLQNLEGSQSPPAIQPKSGDHLPPIIDKNPTDVGDASSKKRRRRKKRKEYDPDDLPEARLRWVKTIEIAISLKA